MSEEKMLTEETENLVEVISSEDKMAGFVKFTKKSEGTTTFSKEQIMNALKENQIIYGINELAIKKLVKRPIYNIKIKVAEGTNVIDGEDGHIEYLVKKDDEYQPVFKEEETVDYKNLNYFQMVKKGQVLCEIFPEEEGIEGKNIYGEVIPAKKGRTPVVPFGKNTELTEDKTKLIAICDGIVKFSKNTIHINEMLHISSNVDFSTGNVSFSGDVTIDGDVCSGFSVKSGGNLIIKGVVEEAKIEAAGNVMISKGIFGGKSGEIKVGKNLRCNYIEKAKLNVAGDITVDYIIDGKIKCLGNINLVGTREVIIGGEIELAGDLKAKEIGNERELLTCIRILGENVINTDGAVDLEKDLKEKNLQMEALHENRNQINSMLLSQERKNILNKNQANEGIKKIADLKKEIDTQIIALKKEIVKISEALEKMENQGQKEYFGSISVKWTLYRGAKIYFGEHLFQHELDNLEHCKIYWNDNEIMSGAL